MEVKNVKFSDLKKGFIDGESERLYNRDNFENAFYDLNGVLSDLKDVRYPTAILIGRKGVGKSAYAARLNLLKDIDSFTINLGEVSYGTFTKISDNKGNVLGTQRYLHSWYMLLVASVVKTLKESDVGNPKILKELKRIYNSLGITEDNSIITDILIASKKDFKVKISGLEFGLSSDGSDSVFKVSNLTDFTNYIVERFTKLEINKPILPVIDGVDDILRTKKDISEILSGLVRAVHTLNQKNVRNDNNVKYILVIRDDIVKTIRDIDMNKIIQDSGCKLDWYGKDSNSDLLKLANKRFLLTPTLRNKNLQEDEMIIWNTFFPPIINNKETSWNHFLEH
ncbi:MAG: P-loop ATPase, Sll1717 family, partial [Vagococcus fluvialis]